MSPPGGMGGPGGQPPMGGMGGPGMGGPGGGGGQVNDMVSKMMEQGKKFPMTWKLLFFVAACCVTAAGVIGTLAFAFTTIQPFGLLDQIYLLIFGLFMVVVDCPFPHPQIKAAKLVIYKYFLFMTRFSGRGLWYLFLGCMSFGCLWDNNISPLLGFFIGGYVVGLGGASTFFGIQKSLKLDKVRKAVASQMASRGGGVEVFVPPNGMTAQMFNEMSHSHTNISFTDEELEYIMNALSATVKADAIISREEFAEWQRGRMTLM